MDRRSLDTLLGAVSAGQVTANEAAEQLSRLPVADLGFALLDTHRELRTGLPEAVFGPGKTPAQIARIAGRMLAHPGGPVIVTKASPEAFEAVSRVAPDARYDAVSRTIVVRPSPDAPRGTIAVAAAGTSDLPIAREAVVTAEACALKIEEIFDVGVAGVHRVLASQDALRSCDAVIVVAGMDGALPAVVAGLTPAPVIAVPTSVGYGASFKGLAALLTMMNACSPGVVVVNIDNGFGAAVAAHRMVAAREGID